MTTFRRLPALAALLLAATVPTIVRADAWDDEQARLDRACEAARSEALAPIREEIREECLAAGKPTDFCARDAAGYDGARPGPGRAPLFYDLPECVDAFEHQQSPRRPPE
jgi:hypothetical protein